MNSCFFWKSQSPCSKHYYNLLILLVEYEIASLFLQIFSDSHCTGWIRWWDRCNCVKSFPWLKATFGLDLLVCTQIFWLTQKLGSKVQMNLECNHFFHWLMQKILRFRMSLDLSMALTCPLRITAMLTFKLLTTMDEVEVQVLCNFWGPIVMSSTPMSMPHEAGKTVGWPRTLEYTWIFPIDCWLDISKARNRCWSLLSPMKDNVLQSCLENICSLWQDHEWRTGNLKSIL